MFGGVQVILILLAGGARVIQFNLLSSWNFLVDQHNKCTDAPQVIFIGLHFIAHVAASPARPPAMSNDISGTL